MLRAVSAIAVLLFATTGQANQTYEKLGRLERESVDFALKKLGRTLQADPAGKTVGRIVVVTREVFAEEDGAWITWANIFHRTTRDDVIEREVLLRPGMSWSEDRVEETVRRLRAGILSNVVVVLPVATDSPGVVDVLVVTRDVWSLRLNSNFVGEQGRLDVLTLSLAETNFLGWRKHAAVTFHMDQGLFLLGPRYQDPNIAGTRLTFSGAGSVIFGRDTGEYEGTQSDLTLAYPLWSLDRRWGGSVYFGHNDFVQRAFQGGELRRSDGGFPWIYRDRAVSAGASGTVSLGGAVKHRISVGYAYSDRNPSVLDDFAGSPDDLEAFESEVLPRRETSSGLSLSYRLFTPRYATYRNLATYDFGEDYRLGPELTASVFQAITALGASNNHTSLGAGAEWVFAPVDDSYLKIWGSWSGRVEDGEITDHIVSAGLWAASAFAWDTFRVIVRGSRRTCVDPTAPCRVALGSSNGLRGHASGELLGRQRILANVELRTKPLAWRFFRMGGVVFYDLGGAADRLNDLKMAQDVGFGIRLLIPQFNRIVIRADVGWRTDSLADGVPNFTYGFSQAL